MCEIPNNVLLVDEFAQLFDGFSIGSNDLTQLTLGVDRDSESSPIFDERDPGVMTMIRQAVEGAHRNGRHSGSAARRRRTTLRWRRRWWKWASTRSASHRIPCCR